MKNYSISIHGLDCANCAASLARKISKIDGLHNVDINYMGEKLIFDCEEREYSAMLDRIRDVIRKNEPDAYLDTDSPAPVHHHHHHEHEHEHEHHHHHDEDSSGSCDCEDGESCSCGHDHEHEHEHHEDHAHDEGSRCVKLTIKGLDCPHCAAKLAGLISEIDGIESADINYEKERLHFHCAPGTEDDVLEKIKAVIKDFDPDVHLEGNAEVEHHHHHDHGHEHEHHHHHDEEEASCSCGKEDGSSCSCEHDHHEHHHEHEHEHHEDHDHDEGSRCVKLGIKGLDCPHCAAKLAGLISEIDGIESADINYEKERLHFHCAPGTEEDVLEKIKAVISEFDPNVHLEGNAEVEHHHHHDHGHEHGHEHEHHEHEHEHHDEELVPEHAEGSRNYKFTIKDIDCANCAANLARNIAKIEGLENVDINFMGEKLTFECDEDRYPELLGKIKEVIRRVEPDAHLESAGHRHHHHHHHDHDHEHEHGHEHEHHEHEHHDEELVPEHAEGSRNYKFTIKDIDCANCAANLARNIAKIEGLENVDINFMGEKLTFECDEDRYPELLGKIKEVIRRVEPDAYLVSAAAVAHSHSHEHHHHDHEGHDHEHHHHHHDHDHEEEIDESLKVHSGSNRYYVRGIDCANCAAELEREIRKIDSLDNVTLTFMNETLSFDIKSGSLEENLDRIRAVIKDNEPDCVLEDELDKAVKKEKSSLPKKYAKEKGQIGASVILLAIAMVIDKILMKGSSAGFFVSRIFYLASYLIVGLPVLRSALRNLGKGQWMDEKFLMSLATVGAIGTGEFSEGVFVMLLYQIGELFQSMAVENSRNSITELMDIKADTANVKWNGTVEEMPVEEVAVDDIIVIRPGEKVPLDGIILSGSSSLNTSALTGESLPRDVGPGDDVISGCVNNQGLLEVRVTKEAHESTVAKILDLVENSSSRKAKTENFISSFAKYYTPTVVFLALFVAFVVPAVIAGINPAMGYMDYLPDFFHRALMFLVVSCPCAIVVSVPLTYFSGIGGMSKKGILVKGSNYLDALNDVDTFVFDKTGTITKGQFSVSKIVSSVSDDEILRLAACAEYNSTHPIAVAIVNGYGKNIDPESIEEVEEIAGHGVRAVADGKQVLAGNAKLMALYGIEAPSADEIGTIVYVARDGAYVGYLVVADEIKPSSAKAMGELKELGIKRLVLLTGDHRKAARSIASQCGITDVASDLLPQDKVERFEELCRSGECSYVGDGINDAPVLAMSNVGIAMGALGSDAAIEAADVVIMNDDLSMVAEAVRRRKKTRKIVMQNIYYSIAVKILILVLSAFGVTRSMAVAIFGDVGVLVLAILNAIRALN